MDALQELEKARALWLDTARAEGRIIPAVRFRPVIYETVNA